MHENITSTVTYKYFAHNNLLLLVNVEPMFILITFSFLMRVFNSIKRYLLIVVFTSW